jgi:hypothetical protein
VLCRVQPPRQCSALQLSAAALVVPGVAGALNGASGVHLWYRKIPPPLMLQVYQDKAGAVGQALPVGLTTGKCTSAAPIVPFFAVGPSNKLHSTPSMVQCTDRGLLGGGKRQQEVTYCMHNTGGAPFPA